MENTLFRSSPCPECGGRLLWTQNACESGGTRAAYRCEQGHVIDPELTRQCPACGIHDSVLLDSQDGRQHFRCARCGEEFAFPR